jgi:hypothetical protein
VERGVAGFEAAGDGTGMGGDGLPTPGRAPALQDDHGLAERTGAPACGDEQLGLAQLLEEHEDRRHRRFVDERRHIVGDRGDGLVARGDQVAQSEAARGVENGNADRAALHDRGDAADGKLGRQRRAEQRRAIGKIEKAEAIGPAHRHVVRGRQRRKLALQQGAMLARFRKAVRQHREPARALGGGLACYAEHLVRLNGDERRIEFARHLQQRAMAEATKYPGAARVDEVDAARKSDGLECAKGVETRADLLGGADDGDRPGAQQSIDCHQQSLKRGLRFSRKARIPSLASASANTCSHSSSS